MAVGQRYPTTFSHISFPAKVQGPQGSLHALKFYGIGSMTIEALLGRSHIEDLSGGMTPTIFCSFQSTLGPWTHTDGSSSNTCRTNLQVTGCAFFRIRSLQGFSAGVRPNRWDALFVEGVHSGRARFGLAMYLPGQEVSALSLGNCPAVKRIRAWPG